MEEVDSCVLPTTLFEMESQLSQLSSVDLGSDGGPFIEELPILYSMNGPLHTEHHLFGVQARFGDVWCCLMLSYPGSPALIILIKHPLLISSNEIVEPVESAMESEKSRTDVHPPVTVEVGQGMGDPTSQFPDFSD